MTDPVFERAVHEHAWAILAAVDRLPGGRSFEDFDRILQALLMAAATTQLQILELPETDLNVFRLTTAAYGQVTQVSASLLEEQAHWRALAALGGGRTPPSTEDD